MAFSLLWGSAPPGPLPPSSSCPWVLPSPMGTEADFRASRQCPHRRAMAFAYLRDMLIPIDRDTDVSLQESSGQGITHACVHTYVHTRTHMHTHFPGCGSPHPPARKSEGDTVMTGVPPLSPWCLWLLSLPAWRWGAALHWTPPLPWKGAATQVLAWIPTWLLGRRR